MPGLDRGNYISLVVALLLAGPLGAQDAPRDPGPPAVVALLEDDVDPLVGHLTNQGLVDASVAEGTEETRFAGTTALAVTPFQRFNAFLPGWKFRIAENPGPGEYRYLRFAWRRSEAPGIMLQLHATPKTWHRYYAGTVNPEVRAWGAMTRVADAPPRRWAVVTRDVFQDFGPIVLTGISFTAMDGGGRAYFDHIYLARSIEDLDGVTAARRVEPATPPGGPPAEPDADHAAGGGRLALGAAVILIVALGAVVFVAWWRRPVRPAAAPVDVPSPIGLACPACGKRLKVGAEMAGKRAKCPACGHGFMVP